MVKNIEDKQFKLLKQSMKGMKKRFTNINRNDFAQAAALLIDSLYQCYELNNIDLNYQALTAAREVTAILEERVKSKNIKDDFKYEIRKFLWELEPVLVNFQMQAARLYD